MGYTHYWSGWLTVSAELIEDVQRLIDASGIAIADGQGSGQPVLLERDHIALNGFGEEGHETLWLEHGVNHKSAGSFCKTARKPYDRVVAAVLLRAEWRSQRFYIRSDGDWNEEEWVAARQLYFDVFDEVPAKPKDLSANTRYFPPVGLQVPEPVDA